VTLQTKDGVQQLRTLLPTVGDVLAERGITLGELDWALPGTDTPIQWNMPIRVVRVSHRFWTEDQVVPFVERTVVDPELELDQIEVTRGRDGLLRHSYKAIIHDGQEVHRSREGTETIVEKQDHVTSYGNKIVWRTVETPEGPKEYWRRFRVWATSYNASHGGKERDSPWYGITATGMVAGRGVVAVDPSVIPLYTRLYVPGYGTAIAGDTGGAVKGRIIDLGFPEDVTNGWGARYVDVYLLGPVPAGYPLRLP
jgi:3D (Asp-Asp-Asp) domain-containing protein